MRMSIFMFGDSLGSGRRLLILAVAAAALFTCSFLSSLATPALANPATSSCEQDILLAAVGPNADMNQITLTLKDLGATIARAYHLPYMKLLKIKTRGGGMLETAQKLAKDSNFAGVQPNWHSNWQRGSATSTSGKGGSSSSKTQAPANDPLFSSQWNLYAMNLPPAWLSAKQTGHWIAVLDSGCAPVADLAKKMSLGASFVGTSSYTQDDGGHGTQMALVAAAITNNKLQGAAVDPWAWIYPIKIGDAEGTDDERIVLGIAEAIRNGIPIILLGSSPSGSGTTYLGHPLVYGMLAIYHAVDGIAVAPAGNDAAQLRGDQTPYLALVSAVDTNKQLANFSNYGNPIWFAAPGVNISAVDSKGTPYYLSGTSYACAQVAAIAAMVWNTNPNVNNHTVLHTLARAAGGSINSKTGYGIIDAQQAINLIKTAK